MMAAEVTGLQVELAGKRRLRRDSEGDMPVEISQFHTVAEPLLVRLGSLTRTDSVRSNRLEMKSPMLEIVSSIIGNGTERKSRAAAELELGKPLGFTTVAWLAPGEEFPLPSEKWLHGLGQCRLILTCVIFTNATVPLRSGFAVGAKAWLGKVIQRRNELLSRFRNVKAQSLPFRTIDSSPRNSTGTPVGNNNTSEVGRGEGGGGIRRRGNLTRSNEQNPKECPHGEGIIIFPFPFAASDCRMVVAMQVSIPNKVNIQRSLSKKMKWAHRCTMGGGKQSPESMLPWSVADDQRSSTVESEPLRIIFHGGHGWWPNLWT
jgi:hypothetical protein